MADIIETVGGGGSSYLVYTGYIEQSGTSAPTVTTFENTTGYNFNITRLDVGQYEFNLNFGTGVTGEGWLSIDNSKGVNPNAKTVVSFITNTATTTTGFTPVKCSEFLTEKEPDFNTWNLLFVAKKSK